MVEESLKAFLSSSSELKWNQIMSNHYPFNASAAAAFVDKVKQRYMGAMPEKYLFFVQILEDFKRSRIQRSEVTQLMSSLFSNEEDFFVEFCDTFLAEDRRLSPSVAVLELQR